MPPLNSDASMDAASIDSLLHALHEIISGPKEAARDWERFRALFVADARLIRVVHDDRHPGEASLQTYDLAAFEEFFESEIVTEDFYEQEIGRRVENFGRIAHSFSAYESRRSVDGPSFQRGLNSFQFFRSESGWRIVTILWDCERPETSIPARYLSGDGFPPAP